MIKIKDEKIKIVGTFILAILLATLLKKFAFFVPLYILFIVYLLFKDNAYRDIIKSFKKSEEDEVKGETLNIYQKTKFELLKRREFFKFISLSLGVFVLLVFLSDGSVISRLFLNGGERQVVSSMLNGEVELKSLNKEIKIKSFEEKALGTFMTVENDKDIPWESLSISLVNYKGEEVHGLLYGEASEKERLYLFQSLKNFNEDYRLRIFTKDKGVFDGVEEVKISDLK